MPIIPSFNKETPRASGGIWWFAVLAGALALAHAVRFFINGGADISTAIETLAHAALAIAALVGIPFALFKAFRSSLNEPGEPKPLLKLDEDE